MNGDQQAIARLKCGDPGGLEVLVRNYQLRALHAAYLILGDWPLGEDIVQNAFLRAARRIHQYDESRPFGPWFLRSVINDAIKAAKNQARQVSLESANGSNPLEWLTDPTPLPEDVALTAETRQAVQRALAQLAPQQRATIVMRYYLGMKEIEMSQQLKSPLGTIKWWLFAGRRRLRQLLNTWVDADIPADRTCSSHSSGDQE